MSDQKENIIREKRTIEATKKNLIGPSGKFGVILQAFGTPIIRQGTGLFDITYMDGIYEDHVYTEYESTASGQLGPVAYRDEILDMEDETIENEGLMFDGLSRGMHLEIIYWHADNKLKVSYKGYTVYLEIAGDLHGYAPFEEWEALIERLYKAARDRLKEIKSQKEAEMKAHIEKKKKDFWRNLRMRWGV